ncbi:MAG: CDP-alcohol phosphatidyltransferase family protein, partial [Candidatus Omnitrophica bacterium]|nr:CDP-alcohol phosphatidyltransferase family protein [Candidatus Omnitrophota bacterium]
VVRLYRGLGTSLAGRLVNTGITPNEITLTGFIFVLIACFFFTRGTHIGFLTGSMVLFFSIVLDFTDGTLARMKNQASMLGDWLDAMIDELREVVVAASLCAGLYRIKPEGYVWILGLTILATDRIIFRTVGKLFNVIPQGRENVMQEVKSTFSNKTIFRITKEFLSVRLLKYTIIPVFALFNKLEAYLFFAAVYGVALSIVFLGYSFYRIKKEGKK